jgi:7-keto-8-aminopelargonate synthetase-like enzyme
VTHHSVLSLTASIIDGIRLSKAQRFRYQHMDLADLEKILKETLTTARNRLIVTDGGFSMDGDIAPLREITDLAAKYDAQVPYHPSTQPRPHPCRSLWTIATGRGS